jgi:hypothetical protein
MGHTQSRFSAALSGVHRDHPRQQSSLGDCTGADEGEARRAFCRELLDDLQR